MGTIVMKGEAEKEFPAEIMEFRIKFSKDSKDMVHAIDSVRQQCENFMTELETIGIDPEQVTIDDDGVSNASYDSEEIKRASKTITFKTRVDSKISSYVCHLVKKAEKDMRQ